jgi:hypothetical protein
MARALDAAKQRDVQKARGDAFDVATALLQVSIVLASAAIITGALMLAVLGGILGAVAAALMTATFLAPGLVLQLF